MLEKCYLLQFAVFGGTAEYSINFIARKDVCLLGVTALIESVDKLGGTHRRGLSTIAILAIPA